MNVSPAAFSSARPAPVVTLESNTSSDGWVSGRGLPVAGERDHLLGLVGLGARRVGVEQVAGL